MSARAIPIALACAAGVSAWLSLGVVAVTDAASLTRIGILPSFRVLAIAIALFAGAAIALRPSTRRVLPLALLLLLWLPWLPGPIPEAFLIWSGPIAWLVWAAVAVGLAWPALTRAAASRWLTDPRRAPALALVVAAGCYLTAAGVLRDRLPAGDEPHYMIITQSLLADHDLRIENNHARGDYAPYFSGELRPDYLRRGLDGEIYSIHAPGVSALVAPAFAVAGYPGAVLALALLAALAMGGLWIVAWQLTSNAHAAWVAWAAVALTVPMFFHAFTIYPDGAGAACTVAGLWLLVALDDRRRISRMALAACGAALAALPWLHTRFAIVAGLLGIASLLRLLWPPGPAEAPEPSVSRGLGDAAAFLAIPIVSAAAWFGYFWMVWGTIDPSAPYGGYTQSALSHLWPGLSGLLADQQFGLVSSAPIYLAAMAGILPLVRRRPRLAVELGVLAITYTIAVASYRMWWGGYSAPARFLVVILPLAAVPLAALWQSCRTSAARAIVLVVLALSLALVLPRVFAEDGALVYNARNGFDLLLDWANPGVNLPLAFPSLHRDIAGDGMADIAIWLAAAALCLTAGWRIASRCGDPWTWACLSLAATAMTASTLVWARHGEAATPGASSFNLLHHWQGRRPSVGWQSSPWALSFDADAPLHLRLATSSRGPREARDAVLFAAPLVPAGDYEIIADGSARPSGILTVSVGRNMPAIEHLSLEERPSGLTGLVVRLPVRVRALTIQGDEDALRTVASIHLRPLRLRDDDQETAGVALSAARYGAVRVFFMDEAAYVEPDGFWTRGGSSTRIVIDSAGETASPALMVRAGPVETTAELSAGRWAESLSLPPGESRLMVIPTRPGTEAWEVEVATGKGFRPAWHDPATRDMRDLGVWCRPN